MKQMRFYSSKCLTILCFISAGKADQRIRNLGPSTHVELIASRRVAVTAVGDATEAGRGRQQAFTPVEDKVQTRLPAHELSTKGKGAAAKSAVQERQRARRAMAVPPLEPLGELKRQRPGDGANLIYEDSLGVNVDDQGIRISSVIFGAMLIALAIPIQWFNEARSIKMETMLSRGLRECVSVDATEVDTENRGRLVHAQGRTRGCTPLVDPQFQDAQLRHGLKLQSTVEVFEWVQTTPHVPSASKRSQTRFQEEWTTIHHDSLRFRKPSPDNPRLPNGLMLGTTTTACDRVELGGFVLPSETVTSFHRFEPAIRHLPAVVHAHGLRFFANEQDGYYYARPSASTASLLARQPAGAAGFATTSVAQRLTEHEVGDIRVRFMWVPEGEATVVAVQCDRDGTETFVPYRPVAQAPCLTDFQARQMQIDEGERPLKDFKAGKSCCSEGVGGCCCCPCNTIACCCTQEVITEEIFYVSDKLDPLEKAFQKVVHRNPMRVWNFRFAGWCTMFFGTGMIVRPLTGFVQEVHPWSLYGGASGLVLTGTITFTAAALIVSAAYMCYRPVMAAQWFGFTCLVAASPTLLSEALGWK